MMLFQQYQTDFTEHIRNPRFCKRPLGVPARLIKVYTEIVFNNFDETLSACFPVSKKVIGVRAWKRLVREFMVQHRCITPLFRQIPEEFLHWLESLADVIERQPAFLYSLAHYEWVELAVAVADDSTLPANPNGDLLAEAPILTPALKLLRYDWPVQRISPRFKPQSKLLEPQWLLVFRDIQDEVQFMELNPASARIVELLQGGGLTGHEVLLQVAEELKHPSPEHVVQFGTNILNDLWRMGAILGFLNHL